jgi:hypothetical protein
MGSRHEPLPEEHHEGTDGQTEEGNFPMSKRKGTASDDILKALIHPGMPMGKLSHERQRRILRVVQYLMEHCSGQLDLDNERVQRMALRNGIPGKEALPMHNGAAAVFTATEDTLYCFFRWDGNDRNYDNGFAVFHMDKRRLLKVVSLGIFSIREIASSILFFGTFDGDRLDEATDLKNTWN